MDIEVHYKNGASLINKLNRSILKFCTLLLAMGLIMSGCQDNEEYPNTGTEPGTDPEIGEVTGKIDFPASINPLEVIVSNLADNSNVNSKGEYALPNDRLTFAYNKDKKLIYIGIAGGDTRNYTLNAKETAIYFSLLAFGAITSNFETNNDIQAYKDVVYSFNEVKQLEQKIQLSVSNRGYLEIDDVQPELQMVYEKISDTFFPFPETRTRSSYAPVTWYSQFNKDFCLDETMISGKDDIYNGQGTWSLTRNLYSARASIVGVKQAKLDPADNLYYAVGDYIKFTSPYFPKTVGLSVKDNIDMLGEWLKATYELYTIDLPLWERFAEMKTYSKKTELSFIYNEGYTDGIVLLSGRDDEIVSLINVIYAYFDVVAKAIKTDDNLIIDLEDAFCKFFLTKYAQKVPNLILMIQNEQWTGVASEMTNIITDFLNYLSEEMVYKFAEELIKNAVFRFADEADIIFGPFSKVFKTVKTISKFSSALLSDLCPSVAIGFTPNNQEPVSPDGDDFSFIVANLNVGVALTVSNSFWLEFRPTRDVPGGIFKVWYHYAPNGIFWEKNVFGRYESIVPYLGIHQTEILWAQFEDAQGNILVPRKGLLISYR